MGRIVNDDIESGISTHQMHAEQLYLSQEAHVQGINADPMLPLSIVGLLAVREERLAD